MEFNFVEAVYLTLMGALTLGNPVPGVENLFADGSECDLLYGKVWESYQRLLDRLGCRNDDEDVEVIINSLLKICELVGYGMYRYGAEFGIPKDTQ